MTFKEFKKQYQKVPVLHYKHQVIDKPLVSVCVMTYQHKNYIKDCLDGILMQQTKFEFEILLGEDASTDGTREICLEYAKKHPKKIRLFLHDRSNVIYFNGNATGRYNLIYNLNNANGKYIALCEGDDYWTDPLKLQKQVDFLEANKEYILTFHSFINKLSLKNNEKKVNIKEKINTKISSSPRTLTLLFRNVLKDYLPVIRLAANGDQPLKFFLKQKGKFKFINEIKPSIRLIHEGGVMSTKSKCEKLSRAFHTWKTIYEIYKKSPDSIFLEKKLEMIKYRYQYCLITKEREKKKKIKLYLDLIIQGFKNGYFVNFIQSGIKKIIFNILKPFLK